MWPVVADRVAHELFRGGGEMGAVMATIDWSKTPLGAVERWSPSLRTMVTVLLANRFPMLLWWGPDHHQLYNDACRPLLGPKHPRSMGQCARDCWPEIWHIIGPLIETPYQGGPATWDDDILLRPNRHGFVEETHFTIACSPVPDDSVAGGVGGVLATMHEITRQVVGDRRVAVLLDLGARSSEAKTAEEACEITCEALRDHAKDIPFALLYLIDSDRNAARLAGTAGVGKGDEVSPLVIDLTTTDRCASSWPVSAAIAFEQPQVITRLGERFHSLPPGPWSTPPNQAVVLPLQSITEHRMVGLLILAVSACLEFDDRYRHFLELATAQVETAIANAQAYNEERRRAEALTELDRVKTAFFNNVSHEFRTPLTLLLGPLEDLLADQGRRPPAERRELLMVAHRNALRLLRLVNTLLDFSRIEAGRVQASYAPTDLGAYSTELASGFRSAVEQAGMRLIVDCPPLQESVYVDREMWEKIVLNLISNAFKFTFEGEIRVELRETAAGSAVELIVRDTGVGIPEHELPRLFQRFHRVDGARGRTHEGSGIGLALVQELVRLHGGSVRVESSLGEGSCFTVMIPRGTDHLPPSRVVQRRAPTPTPSATAVYVEEARRWLPSIGGSGLEGSDGWSAQSASGVARSRVLVADDNADMREYLARLLLEQFEVEVVADGQAALAAIAARPPDLILSDIMMPFVDGLHLLDALRSDPSTRGIPVILLSARAGEEAKVQGVSAGADDYVVKPFAAAELLARLNSQLRRARARADLADLEREARKDAERALEARDEFLSVAAHELRSPIATIKGTAQMTLRQAGLTDLHRVEKALQTIVETADRLAALTDDLLDVSRVRGGQLQLRPERLDLGSLARTCCDRLRLRIDETYEVEMSLPTKPVWIVGDPNRLQQVLANVLNNAAKYSPGGGSIAVRLVEDQVGAAIGVSDRGIGMAADVLEQIFEPYARASSAVAWNLPGLGLGLFISRRIVELHGGRIWAESPGEGSGTTLHVWLPRAIPTAASDPSDGV
jgi:signal transduction histidine kinase